MTFLSTSKSVVRVVIGLVVVGASFYTGFLSLHEHPINAKLIYFAGGGFMLGGLIIDADPIYEAAKKLLALLPSVKIGP